MKISTNEYFQKMSGFITDQQSNIAETQLKLAKGDAISSPSDNTKVATASLSLKSSIERQDGYISNLKLLDMKLSETESISVSASNQLARVNELLIKAANETYSDDDRKMMAYEITAIKDDLFALLNSTDASGNYLFSGIKNRTKPYIKNEQGVITFVGDNTPINIQVGPGQMMRSNASSQDIFPPFRREGENVVTDVFSAIEDIESAITNSDKTAIQQGIADIESISGSVDGFIVGLGTRRKIIESRIDVSEERKLAMTKLYSSYRDLDYGKAVSSLSSQMLALEAAQSSIARVSQLSLFNYLK